jgi:glycosyltransferase involved in cell wall biosynthesis
LAAQFPDHELWAISEFAPAVGRWIPYHPAWSAADNLARCRSDLRGRRIDYTALVLEPRIPARALRWIAFRLNPLRCLFFNENLDHFMLRPQSAAAMAGHFVWRVGNWVRLQGKSYAGWRKWMRRLGRTEWRRALWWKWTRPLRPEGGGGSALAELERRGLGGTAPWEVELRRTVRSAMRGDRAAIAALRSGPARGPVDGAANALEQWHMERDVAWYAGRPARGKPALVIAAPYAPFPLSHGGAVRMFNLMRRAAADYDQVLVVFSDTLAAPPDELLAIFCEVAVVRREGTHTRPLTQRPDTVEEFDVPAFHGALRAAVKKYGPAIVQLEYTRMAMYHADCAPARTILVEHDVKVDLYRKLLADGGNWEWRRQLQCWERFEAEAWRTIDAVVVMSEQDRQTVGPRGVVLANGVDVERFAPSADEPERARLLFIGTFGHLPNLLALEFFLKDVWPRLAELNPVLHVIAGRDPEAQLRHYADRVSLDLTAPGIELDAFVADVRPAYRRAALVIAPLTASAGTNIKVLEAMAMGKAVVATSPGVNGLDVMHGHDVWIADSAEALAAGIVTLLADPVLRKRMETAARQTATERYDWDVIARRQMELYRRLAEGGL